MCPQQVSRRALLRSSAGTALLAVAAGLSGCADGSLPFAGDGGGGGEIEDVPAGAQVVAHADLGDIVTDEQLQEDLDEFLQHSDWDAGPSSVQEGLDRLETQLGFDPRTLREVTVFGELPGGAGDPLAAAILRTDLSRSRVQTLVDEFMGDTEERTYRETTVYAASGRATGWAAFPGDGELILGTEPAVKGVIDRRAGSGDPVSGDLRSGYTATTDGYLRFAAADLAEVMRTFGVGSGDDLVGDVEYVYGGVSRGKDRSLTVSAEVSTADAAGTLESRLRSGLEALQRQARDPPNDRYPELRQRLLSILEDTSIERSGTTVTVTVPDGLLVAVAGLAASLGTFVLGLGSSRQRTPQVAFDMAYDASAETLELTHTGGDHVAARSLSVRGTGLGRNDGDSVSLRWDEAGGSASGTIDDEPAVVAGDSLRLDGVSPDYDVRVVWQPPEGDTAATLAADEGPEA